MILIDKKENPIMPKEDEESCVAVKKFFKSCYRTIISVCCYTPCYSCCPSNFKDTRLFHILNAFRALYFLHQEEQRNRSNSSKSVQSKFQKIRRISTDDMILMCGDDQDTDSQTRRKRHHLRFFLNTLHHGLMTEDTPTREITYQTINSGILNPQFIMPSQDTLQLKLPFAFTLIMFGNYLMLYQGIDQKLIQYFNGENFARFLRNSDNAVIIPFMNAFVESLSAQHETNMRVLGIEAEETINIEDVKFNKILMLLIYYSKVIETLNTLNINIKQQKPDFIVLDNLIGKIRHSIQILEFKIRPDQVEGEISLDGIERRKTNLIDSITGAGQEGLNAEEVETGVTIIELASSPRGRDIPSAQAMIDVRPCAFLETPGIRQMGEQFIKGMMNREPVLRRGNSLRLPAAVSYDDRTTHERISKEAHSRMGSVINQMSTKIKQGGSSAV